MLSHESVVDALFKQDIFVIIVFLLITYITVSINTLKSTLIFKTKKTMNGNDIFKIIYQHEEKYNKIRNN